MPIAQEDSKT